MTRPGRPLCLVAAMAALAWAVVASAQPPQTFLQQQAQIQQQIRRQLDRQLPPARKLRLDWGGWFSHYSLLFDDGYNSSRTLRRNDLRLWASLTADQGIHQGYVRMKLAFVDFNSGDSYDGNDDDWEGADLDRGWYQLDVTAALKRYGQLDLPFELSTRIGRQYVEFGTGYALSMPLDGLLITGKLWDFQVRGLMARTPSSTDNIDRSIPGCDSSDRTFFGIETRYTALQRHQPFAYVLWNNDNTSEDPLDLLQEYDYDSFYVGFGSTGELLPRLRYGTEWVFETGTSYGDRRFLHRDDIFAWGFDLMLEYLPDWPGQPRIVGQYMFASGDPDRLFSPTNAVGGNRGDHDDNSFVGFGYRDTGLSFAPRLSNIHIWRAGVSFLPFRNVELLKRLELGADCFLYHKNRRKAAVSDSLADVQSGYLGWETDIYANWRLASDVACTVRYGAFFPGKAFSDRTTRPFLLVGVTWSF